jgi:hypothetical protein
VPLVSSQQILVCSSHKPAVAAQLALPTSEDNNDVAAPKFHYPARAPLLPLPPYTARQRKGLSSPAKHLFRLSILSHVDGPHALIHTPSSPSFIPRQPPYTIAAGG